MNDREIPSREECILRSGDLIHVGGTIFKFLEGGGKEALITNPDNLEKAMAGETGTRITR